MTQSRIKKTILRRSSFSMSKLPNTTAKEAALAFEKAGFFHDRAEGSHFIYKKPGYQFLLSIPIHKGKDLPSGLLRSLIRTAGLSVDEFVELLA